MFDFKIFRKDNKMTQMQAAKYFGYTQAFISQIERGESKIPEDLIEKIKADSSLNISSLKANKSITRDEVKGINSNIILIPIVSQYAYAGYMNGFADPEYIETLPKMPFFVDHDPKGSYIGFEVRGDSMDSGKANAILEGDLLACRELNPNLWQYKLHINKWFFVIVHKTEGILVKQIIDHDTNTGIIKIHSINPFYEDRELNLIDVAKLFNVVQIQRTPRL